jgi:hypothetical protein
MWLLAAAGCGAFSSDDAAEDEGGAGEEGGASTEGGPTGDASGDGANAGPQLRALFVRSFGSGDAAGDAGATMGPPAIVVDPSGGVALLGSYAGGAVDLGGGAVLGAPSAEDVFLAKLDGTGNVVTSRAFTGSNNPKRQFATALAGSSGALYAAMGVDGTIELASGIYMASDGVPGTFNGALGWFDGALTPSKITSAKGTRNVLVKGVAAGAAGSVIVFGDWEQNISINGSSSRVRDPGTTGLFVGRFSALGVNDLDDAEYCVKPTTCTASALATSATSGDSLAGGRFSGALGDGDAGAPVQTQAGDDDAFLMKLDAQLVRRWVIAVTGTGRQEVHAIAAIPQTTDFIAAGIFDGTLAMAGSAPVTTKGQNDVFVMRVDASGKVLWTKILGGAGDDSVRGVAVDATGNTFLTGAFAGPTLDVAGRLLTNADVGGRGTSDAYVAWLDASGTALYAARFGDGGNDVASAIGVSGAGEVVIAGTFDGAIDFGPGASVKARGRVDTFIAKLAR